MKRVGLIAAFGLVCFGAGVAAGYYVLPESKGESALCIVLRKELAELEYRPLSDEEESALTESQRAGRDRARDIARRYDDECR